MNFFRKPVDHDSEDDERLLKSYRRSGDLTVLAKLYETKMQLVYGVCLKYLKDEEQAKDAVMAIFEELVEKAKRHDVKQFRSWLYVLARNHCLMQLRAGKKLQVVNLDDFMEFIPVLHPEENNRETAIKALEDCLGKLNPAQEHSIRLFYLNEKCYKEITAITGFTLNEVKSYIQNGKRNLKICLDNNSE